MATVQPNPAHLALVDMEKLFPEFTLITQNVDGLHQRAGSRNVIELHGNITRTKCFQENTVVTDWPDTGDVPPKCQRCGGLLRPDVVWFEETLPEKELNAATHASLTCDVLLSVGTSSLVYPAAGLPGAALNAGATVVEINPQPTPFTDRAHFALVGPAGVVLPELLTLLRATPDTVTDAIQCNSAITSNYSLPTYPMMKRSCTATIPANAEVSETKLSKLVNTH